MNQIFAELDKIFHFQLGGILLATAPPSQLHSMVTWILPYFTQDQLNKCLSDSSCQESIELTKKQR